MKLKIIAEFCQNHNGDYSILKEMMHEAADSGQPMVKYKLFLRKILRLEKDLNMVKKTLTR